MNAATHFPSDADLWTQVCAGQIAAFEQVVLRHQSAVCAVAYNVCGDMTASEDAAQEAFWTAWKQRLSLQEPEKLRAWLCGIGRNVARNLRRRIERDTPTGGNIDAFADSEPSPEEAAVTREEQALVWDSLEQIPENYREPLILFYREDHSVADVAKALDLSEDAVKQRLSRGRSMLRDQVAELVEQALTRSKPSRSFAIAVIAGIGAIAKDTGVAMAGTALGAVSKSTMSLAASAASTGMLGAAVGTAGGLAGGWFGSWLPAQLAPTVRERELTLRAGRRTMFVSILYLLILLGAIFLGRNRLTTFQLAATIAGTTIGFMLFVAMTTARLATQVRKIRSETLPDDRPNDSRLRMYAMQKAPKYRGRSYRSATTLLGLPLVDIQTSSMSERLAATNPADQKPRIARGWIAIGDIAYGRILAMGGRAQGFLAFGGMSIGVVSFGGLSLGLVSFGGAAIGAIAFGGLGLGILGLGGLGLGWWACGGGAAAIDTAVGGGAVAFHAAHGGGALARDFATGGAAFARHANDAAAHAVLDNHPLKLGMDWFAQHQPLVNAIMIPTFVLLPLLMTWLSFERAKDFPLTESQV
jgi:zinc protease